MKRIRLVFVIALAVAIVVPVAWFLFGRLEGADPSLVMRPSLDQLGASQRLSVRIADKESGVRRVWVGLLQGGRETALLERDYPSSGFLGGGTVHEEEIELLVEPRKLGLAEGRALLRMGCWDHSWRGWGHGNRAYAEREIMIDTTPPEVRVLTHSHNLIPGGAGLVIYRVSEPSSQSGVYVGSNYFPGHSGHFTDGHIVMAFIALGHTQGSDTELFVKAVDRAGNSTRAGFPHYIGKGSFVKDAIVLSDRFLKRKMPEFSTGLLEDSSPSLVDRFLSVNRQVRKTSSESMRRVGEKTDNILYWDGVFLRLPGSSRQAGYADRRDYFYEGRKIDHQVHLGIDLASVAHAPVPAANSGRIAFVGEIGIYGKTVVIDHGFGLFTTYSHLSEISVSREALVSKGSTIGRTGSTGLAGGDHLHYGCMVHNTFVNPIEWWDPNWIRNNISDKVDQVESLQS